MKDDRLSIDRIYSIVKSYFPEENTIRIEILHDGLRFSWANDERSAFMEQSLNLITEATLRGFLDAETGK